MRRNTCTLVGAMLTAAWLLAAVFCGLAEGAGTAPAERVQETGIMQTRALEECSGLARSASSPEQFWAHNDSGDEPRLYLIDLKGNLCGTVRVDGAEAIDWEDIASATVDGSSYLFIGDIGNNKRKRPYLTVYVLEDLSGTEGALDRESWPVLCAVKFNYADGTYNAEALAVDPASGDWYIITKGKAGECGIYRLPASVWKERTVGIQTAERIGTVPWKKVTGMDISRDGSSAVVLTLKNACEYVRGEGESWEEAFARPGSEVTLPEREQGEAVCYGEGRQLILTSEGESSPIWVVHPDAAP